MSTPIDYKLLASCLALAKQLRELGLQPKGYQLANPYDRHYWRVHKSLLRDGRH
jgi:hypothetical protein